MASHAPTDCTLDKAQDIFSEIESGLNSVIPINLKNLLIVTGYDNVAVLKNISNPDIEAIETFAKTNLHKLLSSADLKNIYGPLFYQQPETFCIILGHRNLLFLIKEFLQNREKQYFDKSTMTEANTKTDMEPQETHSMEPSILTPASVSQTEMSTTDLTEENTAIARILKKWAKSKFSTEKWLELDCDTKFNSMTFNASLTSTDDLNCTVICFCGNEIKITKASKRDNYKSRWICSNYQTHFLKHFQNEGNSLKTRKSGKNKNKITNYLQCNTKSIPTDPNPNIDPRTESTESQNHNCYTPRINILQDIAMRNFIPDDESQKLSIFSNSKPVSKFKRCEVIENDTTNMPDEEILENSAPSEFETENPKTISVVQVPATLTYKTVSIWTSTKYSRSERERRKRESLHPYQTLISNFIPIVDKINCIISTNEDLALSFNNTLQSCMVKQTGQSMTTNKFLEMLLEIASTNQNLSARNVYNENIKKFALYLFYCGGKLLYETLHANLNGILPSLTTLYRFRRQNRIALDEGQFNFKGLSKFLDQRDLPKFVWISEDGTRISGKIEYNSLNNQVMGFVLPLENGIPNTEAYPATSAQVMESYFQKGKRADYAYVIMAQPLDPHAPAFCLSAFGTDNKFTHKDVSVRWKIIKAEAEKFGIKVIGFSSDGDTRLLKSMKINASFLLEPKIPYEWYHIDLESDNTCYMQDSVHIITKLKTRFLKPGVSLPMGNFVAQCDHLHVLIETKGRDKHLLTKSDLKSDDKMNYNSAEKICSDDILLHLKDIPDTAATITYLKIMNFIIASLVKKDDNLNERLYKLWYTIFFLRFWRKCIRDTSAYNLQYNFITLNAYTCIELNGHMLIKLIKLFKTDNTLTAEMFHPWLFNSQPCESQFRSVRSLTSTLSTVVNFSIKGLLSRIDRISFINFAIRDLKSSYTFPREEKRMKTVDFYQITQDDIDQININEIINKSLDDAFENAKMLGIEVVKSVGNALDLQLPIERTIGEDNNEIDFQNVDEQVNANQVDDTSYDSVINTFLENDALLDKINNQIEDSLDLKDYSSKKIDLSEKSPYLKLYLPNKTSIVIKKSSYCWLLDEGNGRVSTDRLRRFISGKTLKKCDRKRKTDQKKTVHSCGNSSVNNTESKKAGMKTKLSDSDMESSEDEDTSEEILLDDSTDTESFSSLDETVPLMTNPTSNTSSTIEIIVEKYYAVLYEEAWFLGRITKQLNQDKYVMKFLKNVLDSYVWPKPDDITEVEEKYIFYGPLELTGTEPFQIKRHDFLNINKKYRLLKRNVIT